MADEDSYFKTILLWVVLPVVFCGYAFKKALNTGYVYDLRKRWFASVMPGIAINYNLVLNAKKIQLFEELHRLKKSLGRDLTIVEVGAGSGANFDYYPDGTKVICVEPNRHFQDTLIKNAAKYNKVEVLDFIEAKAENLSIMEENTADAVISTLVLCSVDDVAKCVSEFHRILIPGGKFLYMEHVIAEKGTFTYKLQNLLETPWKLMMDDCYVTRDTGSIIERADFSSNKSIPFIAELGSGLVLVIKPHIMGTATK